MPCFSYWKGRIPYQGWMYLSVNHLCFHAYVMGLESKVVIRWTDVLDLKRSKGHLLSDTIHITTRDKKVVRSSPHLTIGKISEVLIYFHFSALFFNIPLQKRSLLVDGTTC